MSYNPIAPPNRRTDAEEELRYQVRVVLYFARMTAFVVGGLTALLWAIGAQCALGTALLFIGGVVAPCLAVLIVRWAWSEATEEHYPLDPVEFWFIVVPTVAFGAVLTWAGVAGAVAAGWGA